MKVRSFPSSLVGWNIVYLFFTRPTISFSRINSKLTRFLPHDIRGGHGHADVFFGNVTMGHSDAMMALGLNFQLGLDLNPGNSLMIEPLISSEELSNALDQAIEISALSEEQIKLEGWKVVHRNEIFSLYKRRVPANSAGPVEYLMMGQLPDVSPRTFLHSNIDYDCRKKWDMTMHDMNVLGVPSGGSGVDTSGGEGEELAEDLLYYRTSWPWPLKDRDYTLARRCKVFPDRNAIVLVSRSTEAPHCPAKSGVIRVDNYWCRSAFMASSSSIDSIGTSFVTVFCDDQKVPLPPMVMDILSSQAEKVVPASIARLHAVARGVQERLVGESFLAKAG